MGELVETTVGVVGRAHGLRGEVAIEVRTDEVSRRFIAGADLRTGDGRTLTLASVRQGSGRLIVRFEQVPDRNGAEALRGTELVALVPADERPSGEEEYFDRQLVGLRVLDASGTQAGVVTQIVHGPAQDLLIIDVGGDERLVPFVQALVPVVDLAAGHLQLAEVGGLLGDGAEGD